MSLRDFPFGHRVTVSAVIEPRYLRWETKRIEYDDDMMLGGKFRLGTEVEVDPPVLVQDGDPEGLGDPLPESEEVPTQGSHRRLRRFQREAEGIVVGWVWRVEGEYWGPSGGYDSYTGEYDHDPGGLAETGRVRLFEVALDPGDVGNQFVRSNIVLVHPDDLATAEAVG